MRTVAALALLLLFALSTSVAAQTFGGIGTRAEGMGGAFVAVADDASAIYWNPAGIATGANFDFQISGGPTPSRALGLDPSEAGSQLFVGATMPVLGLSFYRTHTVQAPPDRQNEGSGKVHVRPLTTSNIGVTFVQSVVSGLVIGTTARLVRGGGEAFESRTTVDLDAGALVSVGSLRAGISGRNLRKPEFEGQHGSVAMTRQVRAGLALAPRSLPAGLHGPFSVAFDADLTKTPGETADLRMAAVGGEYWLSGGRVGARVGLRWNMLNKEHRAFSGGLTVRLPRSVFAEGQMTKPRGEGETEWGAGVRVTF
ncbi:MAG TPA: conjugal transfer protein TraF [Vicinamibacterales bacterium]|nr:conjugal transfer protein TraF [Vicinamibacterales bacterium]